MVYSQNEAIEDDLYVQTFNSTRLVIGQSVDIATNGEMNLNIQHHFGAINTGFNNFFGFDQAATRLGIDYSFNDWFAAGIGRTTLEKTWDGFMKFRLLRQKKDGKMPISLTYFVNMGINGLEVPDSLNSKFSERFSYVHQLILARSFGERLSIQIMPTFIHRNLVDLKVDDNDVFTLGAGTSIYLSKRLNLNLEYHHILSEQTSKDYHDSFSVGIDIKTSGHVFQFFLSNSQGMLEQHFLPKTDGEWFNGDIRIGFNIVRAFTLKQKKYFQE
ncbi:MAG: hypothetical protein C0598_00170 [Marinilabiliales bacterium]|nr:MAG: hypothetical protein C0598_00170 [Marinilabiliales bacterium]